MSKRYFVGPLVVESSNLSIAWGKIVEHLRMYAGREISPLVVSISGFDENGVVQEDPEIRNILDNMLANQGYQPIENVAFTIFPQRYWVMAQGDRSLFFKMYRDAFPRLKKMETANRSGLYFERLIMFDENAPNRGNQLETIIERFSRPGAQRMQLQASTYDPRRDQTGTAIQGFPCLQHVTFVPSSEGLILNAFYATQQLFGRAYGNFLGLTRLGAFMAQQVGTPLARVNIHVGIEKLDEIGKTNEELSHIVELINRRQEVAA